MRLYGLGRLPYGLYQDEAYYGLDAVRVMHGAHPIYFEANNGREPLFIYLAAITIRLFGQNSLGLRAASGLVGLLTIPAMYLLGAAWSKPRVGLIAAGVFAVTLWPIHLSHIGFRVGTLPLFEALALGLGAVALRKRSHEWAIAAGMVFGLTFYTYLAARFTPLALVGMAMYGWVWHREWLKVRWRLLAWMGIAAFVVVLPLGIYALQHPDIVFGRSGQVGIWNQPDFIPTLIGNIVKSVGMFNWRGDWIWRHNVPHRPVFDPLMGLAFLAGIALAVARWRKQPALALSLIWVGVMLLPTILAADTPHFLRSVGVIPIVMLIPAIALDCGLDWLSERSIAAALDRRGLKIPGYKQSSTEVDAQQVESNEDIGSKTTRPYEKSATYWSWLPALGVVGMLVISALLTARDYFGCHSAPLISLSSFNYVGCYQSDPVRGYFFQAQATDLANEINAAHGTVYLDRRYWDTFASIQFLVFQPDRLHFYKEDQPLQPVDPPFTLFAWPHDGLDAARGVLPKEAEITIAQGPDTRGDQEEEPYTLYVRYTAQPLSVEPSAPLARFENGLVLVDTQVQFDADKLVIWLKWRSGSPQAVASQMFLHLLDSAGSIEAQLDEPPGTVYYPPLLWGRGSVIIHRAVLPAVPANLAGIALRVGLYDPASSQRIPIVESRVEQQDNALILRVQGKTTP